MNQISKLRRQFEEGSLSRDDYREKMFACYRELRNFQELLGKGVKLEISGKEVVLEVDADTEHPIKMELREKDVTSVPALLLTHGSYEAEETNMVKLLFSVGKFTNFFDIGANIGWYSLNLARGGVKCYAFEPSASNYASLVRNYELNHWDTGLLYNFGFYKENKIMKFYYDEAATGASSMVNLRGTETTKEVEVQMQRLDDFVSENKITGMDFIKCDVEGAELFVFEGGKNALQKFKPVVFCEMLRKWSAKYNYHPNDIIALYRGLGYSCYVIAGEGLKEIAEVNDETVETNFFFLHREKHEEIIRKLAV